MGDDTPTARDLKGEDGAAIAAARIELVGGPFDGEAVPGGWAMLWRPAHLAPGRFHAYEADPRGTAAYRGVVLASPQDCS